LFYLLANKFLCYFYVIQAKQKLTDAWNCGVYCCKYLEAIIESSGENIDLKFKNTMLELKAIRKNMHLILKTELKLI